MPATTPWRSNCLGYNESLLFAAIVGTYLLERRIVLLCVRVCWENKPQLNQYDKLKTAPPTPTTECCQLLKSHFPLPLSRSLQLVYSEHKAIMR